MSTSKNCLLAYVVYKTILNNYLQIFFKYNLIDPTEMKFCLNYFYSKKKYPCNRGECSNIDMNIISTP